MEQQSKTVDAHFVQCALTGLQCAVSVPPRHGLLVEGVIFALSKHQHPPALAGSCTHCGTASTCSSVGFFMT